MKVSNIRDLSLLKPKTINNPKTDISDARQNKPPIIDEHTDKTIDSISVAIAFIALGVFLSLSPTFFFDENSP